MKKRERRTAGDKWRVQGDKPADVSKLGPFDEIVVGYEDRPAWLHVEMLDRDHAFVHVANRCLWVLIPRGKAPFIVDEETREP